MNYKIWGVPREFLKSPNNTRNTITPPLRFNVPSAAELKTPSEMLKEFALPKNPKKEQR